MNKRFGKIGLILTLVVVFPTLFFSAYEIASISNNEQVIDSIYSSQLSNIAFSINQYSDDIVNRWAEEIASSDGLNCDNIDSIAGQVAISSNVIDQLLFVNDTSVRVQNTNLRQYTSADISTYFNSKEAYVEIKQTLEKFLLSGYRKIMPIEYSNDTQTLLVFALKLETEKTILCGMLINSEKFINEYLGPKIQNMAQDKFRISVYDKEGENEVYTSDLFNSSNEKIRLQEELWLISPYKVGISLNGDPIEEMIDKRNRINIIMIIIIDLILLFGAWFVYRNVRKEIQLAQIKSDFVSNVSHEIKTPLALINMYSETLEMGRVSSEEKRIEYIKVINKEANRLSRMVNKILNFSKIENGKREYSMSLLNLNDIVEQIISTYQHHFKNKGFEYLVEYDKSIPDTRLDYEAVTDAVNNLIDNAIKYSADLKVIKIETGRDGNNIFVQVTDSGIGIESADQKLIFDKFYRVTKKNLAHQAKGSGIGLNIVKHIMDAHYGDVKLESTFGKGSCFKLLFPV